MKENTAFEKMEPVLTDEISHILTDLGIPSNLKGYYYSRQAILVLCQHFDYSMMIVKGLYPAVADRYGSSPNRVERNIRHAIEVMWTMYESNGANTEAVKRFFGVTITDMRPTNSHFLTTIADYLIRKHRLAVGKLDSDEVNGYGS